MGGLRCAVCCYVQSIDGRRVINASPRSTTQNYCSGVELREATPTFSVCIANYNGERMLADCIESIAQQSGDHTVEIIVHDDASTDGSLELLRTYPEVTLIESAENVGFCIANNRMADRATGKYLLLLNNDAALLPGSLTALHEAMQVASPCGIVTLPQFDWISGALVDRGCLLDFSYNPIPNTDESRRDVAMVIGACLSIRREDWQTLGGFPAWFESIAEDLYLCCVARLRGWPVRVTTTGGYRHRQGASFSGEQFDRKRPATTFRRRRLSERNKTVVLVVCTPSALMWPLLFVHMIFLLLEGIVLACAKLQIRVWSQIYGPAMGSVITDWSRLQRTRQAVQHSRTISLRSYLRTFLLIPFKLRALVKKGFPVIR